MADVTLTIDGREVQAREGSTILDACRRMRIDTPTLCQLDTLTPVNVCRVCVVELEGARVLVPACSRKVEDGMKIRTDSERVRHSRRLVLELLASSVDMSLCSPQVRGWMDRYGATPARFGSHVATVAQPVKVDNDLYVRDYSRCILCYKCVEACGVDAQDTFEIGVAGRRLGSVPVVFVRLVVVGGVVCAPGGVTGLGRRRLLSRRRLRFFCRFGGGSRLWVLGRLGRLGARPACFLSEHAGLRARSRREV